MVKIKKDYILFDLDGTVTDPKEGITKSVQHSLRGFGIDAETDDLLSFIGPPLRDSYKKYFGFSDADAERAVAKYREYYAEKGIFENTLYEGMDSLLRRLNDAGRAVILATSKPAVYADRILKHFALDRFFTYTSGSELDGGRSDKREVIEYALKNMRITDISKAVMVGDREYDIIGAKALCMDSVGVLYGYGSRQELAGAGATYIADSVDALQSMLL